MKYVLTMLSLGVNLFSMNDAPASSLMDSTMSPKVKTTEGKGVGSHHFGGRGACWSFEMGLGRLTSISLTHTDLQKPNNKLVNV
jgi:hypothetical protein